MNAQKGNVLFSGYNDTAIFIAEKKSATYSSYFAGRLQGKFIDLADNKQDTLLVANNQTSPFV